MRFGALKDLFQWTQKYKFVHSFFFFYLNKTWHTTCWEKIIFCLWISWKSGKWKPHCTFRQLLYKMVWMWYKKPADKAVGIYGFHNSGWRKDPTFYHG